jgi:hypothetical protein
MKSKITDSVYTANVPEVKNLSAEFIYNFYVEDERVVEFRKEFAKFNLDNIPRYIKLNWDQLPISNYYFKIGNDGAEASAELFSKLISEDDSLSPMYLNMNFSEITTVAQGSQELTNYASLIDAEQKSVTKIAKEKFQSLIDKGGLDSKEYLTAVSNIRHALDAVTDLPIDTLGLRVYDNEGKLTDDRSFLKTLATSLTLNMKINKLVIPDFFQNPKSATTAVTDFYAKSLDTFSQQYESAKINSTNNNDVFIPAYKAPKHTSFKPRIIGYVLTRYRQVGNNLRQERKIYLPNPYQITYEDKEILYGASYLYSLSVVAEVDIRGITDSGKYEDMMMTFVSRKSSANILCFEYKPPPPPADIVFIFDYLKRNVAVTWDLPVNRQKDIKQIQVFRRKTVNEPFELIAQYGWDKSIPGLPTNEKYKTGEVVDANNIINMTTNRKSLVKDGLYAVFKHVDNDFVIDTEFFSETSFIYALASVDAHGLISNYSAQYAVKFDPFKNKLQIDIVCDEGSPRSYPNMNIKIDAFKDSIRVAGDSTKKLKIYFSPEYLDVQDERGKKFSVVNKFNKDSKDGYYLLQIINLDNQLVQLLRMEVTDSNIEIV